MKRKKKGLSTSNIKFSICLRVGLIESGPPLSTILGNYGVNSIKFSKDVIEYVNELPKFFLLIFDININSDKTYEFKVRPLTAAHIIRLVSYKKSLFEYMSGGLKPIEVRVIKLTDILKICFLKYGNCSEKSLKMIYSIVYSCNLIVVDD